MVAEAAHGLDADIGADGRELLAQKTHVDLHVIFHRVRVKAPNLGKKRFLERLLRPDWSKKRITSNSRADRRTLFFPHTSVQEARSRAVLPNVSSSI